MMAVTTGKQGLFQMNLVFKNKFISLLLAMSVICVMSLLSGCDRESKEQTEHPYPDVQNVNQDIKNALTEKNKDKRVLLVFGANWCPYCRRIDATLHQPGFASYLDNHYVTIKVNVGKYNQNADISERYNLKVRKGIPAMLVLDHSGTVVKRIKAYTLVKMHKKGRESFFDWFKTI